jgi:exopolysaccharide production protein ExoQ
MRAIPLTRPSVDRSTSVHTVVKLYRDALVYILLLAPPSVLLFTGQLGQNEGTIDVSRITGESSNLINQALAIFLLINGFIVSRFIKTNFGVLLAVLAPLMLVVCWIYMSSSWSEFPTLTLRRAFRLHIEITSVVLLALSLQTRDALLKCIFWSFLIIDLADLASIAVPSISFSPIGFSGIHGHKSAAGAFFFFALPIFAFGIFNRAICWSRIIAAFAFFTALAMLALSLSKTAVLALFLTLVGSTRLALAGNIYGRIILPCIGVGMAVVVLTTMAAADFGISDLFKVLFGDATLTGRDQIWSYAMYRLEDNPLFGVGFGALWQAGTDSEAYLMNSGAHWIAIQAHNGYVDVLAQLGYIGLLLLVIYLVVALKYLCAYSSDELETHKIASLANYSLYVFWGSVLYNITDSSFFRSGHSTWTIFLLVTTCTIGLVTRSRSSSRSQVSHFVRTVANR